MAGLPRQTRSASAAPEPPGRRSRRFDDRSQPEGSAVPATLGRTLTRASIAAVALPDFLGNWAADLLVFCPARPSPTAGSALHSSERGCRSAHPAAPSSAACSPDFPAGSAAWREGWRSFVSIAGKWTSPQSGTCCCRHSPSGWPWRTRFVATQRALTSAVRL